MPRAPSRVAISLIAILLLLQPLVPLALGHGGETSEGHHEEEPSAGPASGSGSGGDGNGGAQPIPNTHPDVNQTNPAAHGSVVVWEEKPTGGNTDIMAYNLSNEAPAFPVSVGRGDELNPDIRGPWVAWEDHGGETVDIAVSNLRTGSFYRVPDHGKDDLSPSVAGSTVFYLEGKQLRGYDVVDQEWYRPAGNHTVATPPDTHGALVAWGERTQGSIKIHIWNRLDGDVQSIPDMWNIKEGPIIDRWGVAFIASFAGEQRGTYTTVYNETTGENYMRTSVYPHEQLAGCDQGFMWTQPGTASTDADYVGLWDGYVDERELIGSWNSNPACTEDHVFYEKRTLEPDSRERHQQIFMLNMTINRVPVEANIKLDPGLEHGIFSGTVTFTGTATPEDPRAPLQRMAFWVDGQEPRNASVREVDGSLEFQVTVDASRYFSGVHTLRVSTLDARQIVTTEEFQFFTNEPYKPRESALVEDVAVPRTQPSPFPFNLVDHYGDYQPFYNTILLALLLIAGAVWGVRRYLEARPRGTPEYVPPDEQDGGGAQGPP